MRARSLLMENGEIVADVEPVRTLIPAAAAVAVCAACVLSLSVFHALPAAGLIALLILEYRLGRSGSQLLAALLALPFLVLALAGAAGSGARIPAVLLAALGPAAAWAGAARRARSEAAEHSAAREVIAGTLVEHTARGERARVSRELHDVVAHHISMIAVQAETARLTTAWMPAAGAQRLSAIGDTARAALTEMRRLLGVLREDAAAATDTGTGERAPGSRAPGVSRQPQPGLAQLAELIDAARDASVAGTRLIISGPVAPLDPGVELAAYRIVQEALTNARRHATGAAVDVELRYGTDTLRLRVRDSGPGIPPEHLPLIFDRFYKIDASRKAAGGSGLGLSIVRAITSAHGGSVRARAREAGGLVVEVRIPAAADAMRSSATPTEGSGNAQPQL